MGARNASSFSIRAFFGVDGENGGAKSTPAEVFISYARSDNSILKPALDAFEKLGVPTWIDVDGLTPGDKWRQSVDDAINSATAVVFFASPMAVSSDEVAHELRMAEKLGKPILPIFVSRIEDFPEKCADLREILFGRHILDLERYGSSAAWVEAAGAALKEMGVASLRRRSFDDTAYLRPERIPPLASMSLSEVESLVASASYKQRMERLQAALKANPADPVVQAAVGQIHLVSKRYNQAQESLKEASKLLIADAWTPFFYALSVIARRKVAGIPITEGRRVHEYLRSSLDLRGDNSIFVIIYGAFVLDFFVNNGLAPPFEMPEELFDKAQNLTQFPKELEAVLKHLDLSDKSKKIIRTLSDESIDSINSEKQITDRGIEINYEKIKNYFSIPRPNNPERKALIAFGSMLVALGVGVFSNIGMVALSLILAPFAFSFFYSGRNRWFSPYAIWKQRIIFGIAFSLIGGIYAGIAAVFSLGMAAYGYLAVKHFWRRHLRASDRDVDVASLIRAQKAERSFYEMTGQARGDFVEPAIVHGIEKTVPDVDKTNASKRLVLRLGEDDRWRSAGRSLLLANFTRDQLIIYRTDYDLRTSRLLLQKTDETYFKEVDTVTVTRTQDTATGWTEEWFTIRTTGNAKFEVLIAAYKSKDQNSKDDDGESIGEETRVQNDRAIIMIRREVQRAKTADGSASFIPDNRLEPITEMLPNCAMEVEA